MKSLTAPELVSFCEWLRIRLSEAQLQDLWTDGECLVLQFYRLGEVFMVLRLHPSAPLLWLQSERPGVRKTPKPVTLFLAAHGRGKVLREAQVLLQKGRSLCFLLSARDEECEIEIDLIPRNPNLTVRAAGKSIHWNKPKDLPPPVLPEMTPVTRDWEEWCREAAAFSRGGNAPTSKKSIDPAATLRKQIEKKTKAIEALEEQLRSDLADRYRRLGEHLKMSSEPLDDLRDLFDNKISVGENRERAFHKAKETERKKTGTQERIRVLTGEIEKLRHTLEVGSFVAPAAPTFAAKLMRKGEAQGRKLQLEGGFEAVIGKSGADNLAILRQARAWDYWLHLKDEPGAHAILFRNRDQEVPGAVIRQVAEWVWQESRGKKTVVPGGSYDVLVVECRFVKPIKGDRLGRVNYRNPRVYTFASKTSP